MQSNLLEVKILELELSLDDARGLDTGAQNILHNRGLLDCDEEACKHPPSPPPTPPVQHKDRD